MKKFNCVSALVLLFAMLASTHSFARTGFVLRSAGGIGSGGAHSNQSAFTPGFGAEFDFGIMGNFDLGVHFDYNLLLDGSTSGSGGSVLHYGAVVRYYIMGALGVFTDLSLGLTSATQNNIGSDASFAFGFKVGSKLPFLGSDFVHILPFGGVRYLPYSVGGITSDRVLFDFGFMFSFALDGGDSW